ncbi:MAG TPA: hypothetical protein VK599_06365 [Streptosporangiaceae bacterium]|nr:hypothetical protein [Streptosporangiaceae bacterium]
MPASLDLAAPKLGSGARFRKLSTTLAARGAKNPDALAAFIGRKRYGNAGMGKLSAGKSLANDDDLAIYLAETTTDNQGKTLTCPECSYSGPPNRFGASGADVQGKPAVLRTPAPSTGGARKGVPLTVKVGAANALANGTREALELATGKTAARRHPVREAVDVRPERQPDGSSVLRHRNGGAEIARIRRTEDGKWVATVGGKDLPPRSIQRTALMEAVGTYNGALTAAARRQQDAPLQPSPQQTELMAEYGIPAMRSAAFATPTAGASDGPRMTTPAASGDAGPVGGSAGGLSPKAQAIYKKLKAKGFPDARALAFARNSEKFGKPATAAA